MTPRQKRRKLYNDMVKFRAKHPDYSYAELAEAFKDRGVGSTQHAWQILNNSCFAKANQKRIKGNGGLQTR